MNFIKRIAEMAQSRLLGSGGGDGRPAEIESGFDNVTPSSSALPANGGNLANAPQRRAIGGTRYAPRAVPLRINVDEPRLEDLPVADPNEPPPRLVAEPPQQQQQRIHHRHPFQIQVCLCIFTFGFFFVAYNYGFYATQRICFCCYNHNILLRLPEI